MTDHGADVAAYIGALAWFPQIVSWIWSAFSRPSLRVRAGGNIQIGHGGLGGIIGLNVALATERKDALIDDVRARVTHESGDRRDFAWNVATENQTEMRNDNGERVQMSRTQSVLAIKVSTQTLAERFIGLHVAADQPAIVAGQTGARTAYADRVRVSGDVDWNEYLRDAPAQAVRTELERAFHWQEGRYSLLLTFSVVGGTTHEERFEFNLGRADVELIRQNLARWHENLLVVINGGTWPTWNFCYPLLVRT